MRNALIVIVAIVSLGVISDGALAKPVQIGGTWSPADIKKHCKAAGGTFDSSGSQYDCIGPGGNVSCVKGKCRGWCDACGTRQGGEVGLGGILQPSRGGIAPPKSTEPPKGTAGLGTVKTGGLKQNVSNNQTIQVQHTGGGNKKH